MERVKIVKPGMFSICVNADARRSEFDVKNEIIVTNNTCVDFVFIGDSIIHNWELSTYFGMSERIIVNRGICGDAIEYIYKRFEVDLLKLKPNYAVIMAGINNTWVLDEFPRTEFNSADYVENLIVEKTNSIINYALERKQKLILCSILPVNIPAMVPGSPTNGQRNEMILKINSRLKVVSLARDIIFVDYHSNMVEDDGKTLRRELSDDGIHPHVLGYNIMAEVLRKTLKIYEVEI